MTESTSSGQQMADLDEAISRAQEAIEASSPGDRQRNTYLAQLANALLGSYAARGNLADLEKAIEAGQQALDATPADDPRRSTYLAQLASALFFRSQHSARRDDLEEAIILGRQALAESSATDSNHGVYLSNLGNMLLDRFRDLGNIADLDEAVALERQALTEGALDEKMRRQYASNLADVLLAQAQAASASGDQGTATSTSEEVLTLIDPVQDRTPDGMRALRLRAAASRMLGRYEDAEKMLRQVLASAPDDERAAADLAEVLRLTGREQEASAISDLPTISQDAASLTNEGALRSSAGVESVRQESEIPDALAGTADGQVTAPVLSRSASEVIARATVLAGSAPVDASTVLLAALRFCYETSHPGVTGALLTALSARQPDVGDAGALLDRLGRALGATSDSGRAPDPNEVAGRVQRPPLSLLLALAADAAERISDRREVHLRHLVLAAVLATDPPLRGELLAEAGVSAAELRLIMREAARAETTGEPVEKWDALLPVSSDLAGGIDTDLVDPRRGISLDQDDLEVGVWVSMLAAVIVDASTPMPLSVGIFGEWGSGKSYFMGLLRSEIDVLSGSGREPYLAHVVQIGFNAWHYADTNLWASLGDEIFRQLAGPSETADESRRRLREDLAKGSAERQALEERTAQARHETMRLQAELEEATAERQVKAVDLLRAARKSAELRKQLDKVWQRLGIRDETQQARLLADQVRGTAHEARALRSLLGQQRIWVLSGISVLALLAIVTAAWIPVNWNTWLAGGGTTAIAVALGTGAALLARARTGLTQLQTIASELISGMESSADERTAESVKPAVDRLRRAEANEKVAQVQLDEVVARVGQLAQQLSDLMPGQRLYTFLAERAASGAYTRQLGLISTIRKDFEHLVELLRDRDDVGDAEPARRPIDRIVLYIDDLDRCGPQQVVEVLQAVHLLLALDLFVVVVGVDPRWLLHSLRHQYQAIIDVKEPRESADHGLWDVTPQNYLEKIFNIPFVLPGIPVGGLGRVLRGLARADHADQSARAPAPIGTASLAAKPDVITPSSARSAGTEMPVEAESELAARHEGTAEQPPRPLTEPELRLLSKLESFVDTPREAKRLFNLYRMLRATRDLSDASSFLGDSHTPGEYQAVAVLLGMLTADADLLAQMMDAPPQPDPPTPGGLAYRPASDHWHQFVSDLAPVQSQDMWTNKIVGNLYHEAVPRWQRLASAAAHVDNLITLPDLTAFQRWAPRIRRFSFLLLTLNSPPPAEPPPSARQGAGT